MFITFVMMCVLFSCSIEETQVISAKDYDSKLLQKASFFNDSIINTRGETRSKGGATLFTAHVVIADVSSGYTWGKLAFKFGSIFGPQTASTAAICAGMIGAVSGSCLKYNNLKSNATRLQTRTVTNPISITADNVLKAYVQVRKDNIDISSTPVTVLTESLSDQDKEIQYFGSMHNAILDNLLNGKLSDDAPHKYFSNEELAVFNSEEFRAKFNAVMAEKDILDEDNSTTGVLMELFEQIFTTYPDCREDIEFITNKYIELVKQSNELSDFDKKLVLSALSVSMASTTYWEDYHGLSELMP